MMIDGAPEREIVIVNNNNSLPAVNRQGLHIVSPSDLFLEEARRT